MPFHFSRFSSPSGNPVYVFFINLRSAYLLYDFVLFVDGHKDTVDNDDKHDE